MIVIASHSKGLGVRAKPVCRTGRQSVNLIVVPKLKQIASSALALTARFPTNDGKHLQLN